MLRTTIFFLSLQAAIWIMMYLALGLTSARRRDGETIQNANEAAGNVHNDNCYPLTSKADYLNGALGHKQEDNFSRNFSTKDISP